MAKQRLTLARFLGELVRIMPPVLILAAGVAGYLILSREEEAPARAFEEEEAPLVETVRAAGHDRGLEIQVDGVVVPYREVELSAEIDGTIQEKDDICRAGSYITPNTLLLKIDPRDYQLEVDRLANELRQAEVNSQELDVEIENTAALIDLAEKQLELQEASFKREERLHRNGFVSDEEFDLASQSRLQAENALLTLRSQLQVFRTRRGRLQAAKEHASVLLKKAELDLTRTEIRVPQDTEGVVVSDLVEQGDYVRKGTPLVTIEDTSKVEVKCSFRLDELYWLWDQTGLGPGQASQETPDIAYEIPRTPVTVVYRLAGRDYQWGGVLARYDGIGLDQSTRTVPCRVVVDAPRQVRVAGAGLGSQTAGRYTGPPALVRGMYVIVKVHGQPRARLVRIPEKAVRPGSKVWVVREGTLEVIDVHVVRVAGGEALVLAGDLDAGVKVVVTPLTNAADGMEVMEVEEAQQEKAVR